LEKENVVKKKKKIAIDADEELAPKTRRKKSEEDVSTVKRKNIATDKKSGEKKSSVSKKKIENDDNKVKKVTAKKTKVSDEFEDDVFAEAVKSTKSAVKKTTRKTVKKVPENEISDADKSKKKVVKEEPKLVKTRKIVEQEEPKKVVKKVTKKKSIDIDLDDIVEKPTKIKKTVTKKAEKNIEEEPKTKTVTRKKSDDTTTVKKISTAVKKAKSGTDDEKKKSAKSSSTNETKKVRTSASAKKTGEITKDYIKIRYRDDDILYVPTNSLDTVRKYVGGDGVPKIYKLGGKDWSNTKAKVKNNLRAVARELIELYAKRQKAKGHAFSKDNEWQTQFENSFPYIETDDQLRCIDEVKKDMEDQKPMDRLLCGDVGYGKTEVAIRAAFKCVMDQKQVVYLVPTTVLADQQYENFKERMKEYPIRVEVLNRFKTKKQQDDIIKKLKLGEIDVIVGTHRVLSKDVEFKDLGLLIIDEEHRFGVKDKEKIKQLKNTVDVLTMTATPIPRTLHMSIVGVRDMSVIYEPPQNRKPVQTYVMEYDPEIIKEAITKELERGGQVYYLYNNVEGIAKKAAEISTLVDEAKVSFAHGKMTGKEIEEIMADFVTQKTNVLVCTTILESGIDIPNANTIIVENAERLGLAQLYQIRGRVGRSNKQAYAYIMYKRDKILSEVANKRLKSIKEFTEFGSGFKIAMRDLEIRGAGSLLGEIQHGHMEQVGYDMYCKLLDEVVKEMQGYEVEEDIDVQIDINISSYIPDEYISDSSQKIEIYQDIALCNNEADIQDVINELIDRYGVMPEELENLIEVARIKQLAKLANIIKISQRGENFVFYFNQKKFDVDVSKLVEMYKNRILFSQAKDPYVTLKIKDCNDKTIFEEIKKFLNVICGDKSN
jgi:transcription-repair coupling factor (superfamily II helicase)